MLEGLASPAQDKTRAWNRVGLTASGRPGRCLPELARIAMSQGAGITGPTGDSSV